MNITIITIDNNVYSLLHTEFKEKINGISLNRVRSQIKFTIEDYLLECSCYYTDSIRRHEMIKFKDGVRFCDPK